MGYTLRNRMTDKRREWLEELLNGPARRKSKVGCECMRLGWTEWVPVAEHEAPKYEQITSAGREALLRSNDTGNGPRQAQLAEGPR